jgi:hypothetical protein
MSASSFFGGNWRFLFGPNAMQALDAHAMLADLDGDELIEWLPQDALAEGADHTMLRLYAPLLIVGGISLSGMLDDAQTVDDLREAAQHFSTLLSCGVASWEQWGSSTRDLFDELELFARQFDRAEELN